MSDKRLSLPQAADRLQWSVRFLKSRLAAHNIAPIGRGRAARVTEEDLKALEAKERTACGSSTSHPASAAPRGISAVAMPRAGLRSPRDGGIAAALRRSHKTTS